MADMIDLDVVCDVLEVVGGLVGAFAAVVALSFAFEWLAKKSIARELDE